MTRGRFVTLEGVEGAGKSTHARLLAETLRGIGLSVAVTREPGGTDGAEAIRRLLVEPAAEPWAPMTEALLHYAARREHLDRRILPELAAGRWVVCDRFADSTSAYQGYGQGLNRDVIETLHTLVVGAVAPDLTIVLDLDVSEGLARTRGRSPERDRYERMDLDFHRRVRDGFLEIARRAPRRCTVIDAAASPEQVRAAIWDAVRSRLAAAFPAGEGT